LEWVLFQESKNKNFKIQNYHNIIYTIKIRMKKYYQKYKSKKNKKNKKQKIKNKNKTIKNIKKMNCNPAVKGKTSIESSCLTDPILIKLKDSYNKHHNTTPILSNEPTQIWNDLRERMTTCLKEDCWLDVIDDNSTRKKINEMLFAPKQPKEWKMNPNTWLSNYDIFEVLAQYEAKYKNFKVIGPTPIDFDTRPIEMNGKCVWEELCTFSLDNYLKNGKTKLGIVFNLDKHNSSGSHWVSMFVDLEDEFIFYLDSAGNKIPIEVEKLAKRIIEQGIKRNPQKHIHLYENCPVEHQMGSTECGMYALYFIITMLTSETEGKVFKNYIEKIRFFKDKQIPDKYVNKYRKIYFNE